VNLDTMIDNLPEWLEAEGPDSEIILSSRIRLARNLGKYSYAVTVEPEATEQINAEIRDACLGSSFLSKSLNLEISDLSPLDRHFLMERHLISRNLVEGNGFQGLIVGDREIVSIMINEEDHLRLQSIRSGFQLLETYRLLDRLDDELSSQVEFAFHEEFGYLTSCPTNAGTGLRASVLIHLPALVLTKKINEIVHGINQMGLTVRGYYGEGSEVMGNLFQLSNQNTLGQSEEEIIGSLNQITSQITDYERQARDILVKEARVAINDKIWRAYGILSNARVLSAQEVMNLLSAVRLGLSLGVLDGFDLKTLNQILIYSQKSHLQKLNGVEMNRTIMEIKRADFVREKLTAGVEK
jgi:protein arginine kinase